MSTYYITGDLHFQFRRFDFTTLTKEDWIIVLGDHQLSYFVEYYGDKTGMYGFTEKGEDILRLIAKLPVNFFVINGTRECPCELLDDVFEDEKFGGNVIVHPLAPNVVFAMDSEVYQFGDRKCLVFGGATAPDQAIRDNAHNNDFTKPRYFPESEKHTNESIDKGIRKDWLEANTLLCHTCPIDFRPYDFYKDNIIPTYGTKTEENLQYLISHLNIKDIYSGYFHIDASKKFDDIHQHFLYNCIEKLAED